MSTAYCGTTTLASSEPHHFLSVLVIPRQVCIGMDVNNADSK